MSPKFPGLRQVHALEVKRVPTGLRVPAESFTIKHPVQAADIFKALTDRANQESLHALHLDNRHKVVAVHEVARGAANVVHASPREVFAPALLTGASEVVIGHNHPSGDPSPSADDVDLTVRMKQAGEIVGVPVLDHVVVGDEDAYSIGQSMRMSARWSREKSYGRGEWGAALAVFMGWVGLVALVAFLRRRSTAGEETSVGALHMLGAARRGEDL